MRPVVLLIAGCSLAATAQTPNVEDLVRRSVQAIEADWQQAPGYSYEERDVVSKHRGRPVVETFQVVVIDGSPYHRLLAANDHPLSAADQAEEDRRMGEETRKRLRESDRERAKRIAKYDKERRRDHAMLLDMLEVFDFQLVGEENVEGHDCWVLDARPKPDYEPRNHETKVLAGMRGRLWIDKSQNQWVRVQAEVFKPVNFFGFLAKVGPGTRFLLEQEPVADNLWLPKRFSVQVKASALGFLDESSTDDETYADYRPIGSASAVLPKPRPQQ